MGVSDGRIIGSKRIVDHGSIAERLNLVIVAEGYRDVEMPLFEKNVNDLLNEIQRTPPFSAFWTAFNVTRIDVASRESGADDPKPCGKGTMAATYFDATFCSNHKDQRILTANEDVVLDVVGKIVPEFHQVIVLVNRPDIYGGTGGAIAVFSTCGDYPAVAMHEMGHSIFGFWDEYDYYSGCNIDEDARNHYKGAEPATANVTASSDRKRIKWKNLIKATMPVPTMSSKNCSTCNADPIPPGISSTDVGAFEGGGNYHCDIWRPTYTCKMRETNQPFCAVCQDKIRATLAPFTQTGSCGVIYAAQMSGKLRWYRHLGWADGSSEWSETVIKNVWGNWFRVISGHEGAIYTVDASGGLHWHFHRGWANGDDDWNDQSGKIIGSDWKSFYAVVAGTHGVLYTVDNSTGLLYWYRFPGWKDGMSGWKHNPHSIGSGWKDFKFIVSAGEGVLYGCTPEGILKWYRHTDWYEGSDSWVSKQGMIVGGGWQDYVRIISGGGGVLYGQNSNGELFWYRHLGWLDGTDQWVSEYGIRVGTDWASFVDVSG